MKRVVRRFLLVVGLVVVVVMVGSLKRVNQLKVENSRLSSNQKSLLGEAEEYRVRDSLNAVSVRELQLQRSEFEEYFGQMSALVKDVGIRLRRVEEVSQNAIESNYEIETPVVDSVVRIESDTTPVATVNVQSIMHKTPHISLEGFILDSRFYGKIKTYDTLTQIVHRVPRRFLFFRWGTKELRQEIVSSNPHSKIVYSKTIVVSKRKRKRSR